MGINEFKYDLEESFRFSYNGEFYEAESIVVSAPSKKIPSELFFHLEGLTTKSQQRAAKEMAGLDMGDTPQGESKISDEDMRSILVSTIFSGLDKNELLQFLISFKEILKKSAKVCGRKDDDYCDDKNFEDSFYECISIDDQRNLIGIYLQNFIRTFQSK